MLGDSVLSFFLSLYMKLHECQSSEKKLNMRSSDRDARIIWLEKEAVTTSFPYANSFDQSTVKIEEFKNDY